LIPAELESIQPNFMEELNKRSGGICFASTAKNEIKFEGRKLIGSAQRKLNDSILQHGSILCGTMHRNLPDYFYLDDVTKNILKAEMTTKTIELESILSKPTDYKGLTDALRQGFQQEFKVRLINREELKCYA
jgi:lipoate-protein ligase A